MDDLGVISCTNHTQLRTLPFSRSLDPNSFVVGPAGDVLLAGSEIVDVAANRKRNNSLPANIFTGSSWAAAPIPGGPAVTPDGRSVFFGTSVGKLDLASNTMTTTGFGGDFMSDITVSPDGRVVALSTYSYGSGRVSFYDANNFQFLGAAGGLGDYSGEVVFAGNWAVVGTAGNPANGGGYLSVIDTNTFAIVSQIGSPLADNVAASERGEVFAAVGQASDGIQPARQGVDVFVLNQAGQLRRVKTFFLGVNRWVSTTGRPQYDQIQRIVYKR